MILYITEGWEKGKVAEAFYRAYPRAARILVQDNEEARRALYEKEAATEKHHIFITPARGRQFRVCPGTGAPYICCYYWTLHQSSNCPFDCTYCILQYYLNNPLLTVFANTEALGNMVKMRIDREPQRLFRVGTGELADSLALDHITRAGPYLIRLAAAQKNMLLELKTKSDNIDHLLDVPHGGKTIISWSLNPAECIRSYEYHAADLDARMCAVEKVQDAGYLLGFHFDPLLIHAGWPEGYEKLVERLFRHARPDRIAWISLGSLRFPPEMAEKMRRKFPDTDMLNEEMIRGVDGKMRYFKPRRLALYRHLYQSIRHYGAKDLFVYFCMEDAEVWRQVMGFAPDSNEHLDYLFAAHLTEKFPNLDLPAPNLPEYRKFESPRSWEL
ncbi:MAG: spore photoproduct lyase family protein [Candidatus Neomarinimicrobiota bacterium]|jgi:spore photoproduct lyase|nr:DNA photolyase [Candidatus Neomarinimicrobiota bacterium]MDD3966645.1 DNA photolyase [Candidatus Neomarinimicrobiota bacterium]MDX9780166.1 DNA photolyase [bacterium]